MSPPRRPQPSKEFTYAVEDFKQFWSQYNVDSTRFYGNDDAIKQRDLKLAKIKSLAQDEGLILDAYLYDPSTSLDYIDRLIYAHETKCKQCGLHTTSYAEFKTEDDDVVCPKCQQEKDRQLYYELQAKEKAELEKRYKRYPVLEYCDKIRGITHIDLNFSYEESKEEREKDAKASADYRTELRLEEINRMKILGGKTPKPEGVSKKKWEWRQRNARKEVRDQYKHDAADIKLELEGTPAYYLAKVIEEIGCECKAEEIRVGEFCYTCKLLKKAGEYILDLFKREAEGRGTIL